VLRRLDDAGVLPGMVIIGSLVVLVVGYWFSLVKIRPDNGDDAI